MSLLRLGSRMLEQFGLKRPPSPLTREQAFQARPVRNPALKWRLNDEDNVEIIVPRRSDRMGRILGFLFYVPETRPLVLDEVGTRVWQLCDGERTVEEIVQVLSDQYILDRHEVELSLTAYMRTLGRRGMIGFLVPEEMARELGEQGRELVGLPGVSSRSDLEKARAQADQEEASPNEAEGTEAGAGQDTAAPGAEDETDQTPPQGGTQ